MKVKTKQKIKDNIKALFRNSKAVPLIILGAVLCILLVLFRMKAVEQDYKTNEINRKIRNVTLENKRLKAQEAELLSSKNLRDLAKKHKLAEPSQKQIIVVPE